MNEVKASAFGPVPSRRLGRSLGINNIPLKFCTYSCVYCQLGKTLDMQVERRVFYGPERACEEVDRKVKQAGEAGEPIDFLTFVPDGEPTLDADLGREIEILRSLGVRIGVISNASLIWQAGVRSDLAKADWVSLKIDAVTEGIWRRVNRPHRSLKLDSILDGVVEFSNMNTGELATETMLVRGVNDTGDEVQKVADFIAGLGSDKSYISIPTRPPAAKWVNRPGENTINAAYQVFRERSIDTEYLIGYEGNAFASTGDIESDLLSITSVHPMREEAVSEFLAAGGADWALIDRLIAEGEMLEIHYEKKRFYMRSLPKSRR